MCQTLLPRMRFVTIHSALHDYWDHLQRRRGVRLKKLASLHTMISDALLIRFLVEMVFFINDYQQSGIYYDGLASVHLIFKFEAFWNLQDVNQGIVWECCTHTGSSVSTASCDFVVVSVLGKGSLMRSFLYRILEKSLQISSKISKKSRKQKWMVSVKGLTMIFLGKDDEDSTRDNSSTTGSSGESQGSNENSCGLQLAKVSSTSSISSIRSSTSSTPSTSAIRLPRRVRKTLELRDARRKTTATVDKHIFGLSSIQIETIGLRM